MKQTKSGTFTRLLRHSDDCRMSSDNEESLLNQCRLLSDLVRVSEWKIPDLFLGCEIEYGDHVALLRLTSKILITGEEYMNYRLQYNPKRRVRKTGLPSGALEQDLLEDQSKLLKGIESTHYRGIVGSLNWISFIRMDCKFYQHVVAGKCKNLEFGICIVWSGIWNI